MGGFDPMTLAMIAAVIALFYFMLVRPQKKRAKEQKEMMNALKAGDRVMTISGIVGTIRYLGEKQAIIEISPGVEMTVVKGALSTQPVEDEFEYSDSDADDDEIVEPETTEAEPTDDGPAAETASSAASEPGDTNGAASAAWDDTK
jgi:preprotein translocase subunit YajC